MFENRHMNLGWLSVASIIFVAVVSVSFANAESSLQRNTGSAQSYVSERLSSFQGYQLAEGNIEDAELEEIEEVEFIIKGMTCGNCENAVKAALMGCSGVKDAKVSYKEGSAVIEADANESDYDEIIEAVEKAGFTVVEDY